MSDYRFPYKDAAFLLNHIVDFDQMCLDGGRDDVNFELAEAILEEAGRFGGEVLAPLNRVSDESGAQLVDNAVHEVPGFAEAYRQYVDNGWPSLAGEEEYGGQAMPRVLASAVQEVWETCCTSFSLCGLLTSGAFEALDAHGSDELKNSFLPNMISGEWTGSMCLTEPAAGSDLAAVTSKAIPEGDHFLLTGQKIFITWGDHQMTENIIHLVLARLPDAPAGVKGISLFLVPKFILDENGQPGQRNDVYCVGIEHKLGIHGSPTCTMSFGENGGAVGYMVGEPNKGLMAMFTMMNQARQGVGLQSMGISEGSYQQSVTFAKERLQGTRRDGTRYPIIEFPDVRRMLMVMRSAIEAMRGLVYVAAAESDRCDSSTTPEQKQTHARRTALYTPIVKGWMSELSQEVTYLGVQVHGGMGFVEETGIAQYYRDARITTIYEGTTGIQGLDLVGRKILADDGEALQALLNDIQATADEMSGVDNLADMGASLQRAIESGLQARAWLLENADGNKSVSGACSVNFMMMLGFLCGGWVMGMSTLKAGELLKDKHGDTAFLQAKQVTAQFYFEHLLPRCASYLEMIQAGDESMMALGVDQF